LELIDKVWSALEEVHDPEVGVNIVDLGLVYDVQADEQQQVAIKLTMTTPHCPLQGMIVDQVADKVRQIPGVKDVQVQLVWDPPWTPAKMTDRAIEEIKRRRALI